MIYYLYGPDSLRRNRKLKELLSALKERVSSTEEIDADLGENQDAWKDIRDFVNQQSIFGGAKIVMVENAASSDDKDWVKFLKGEAADGSVSFFISDPGKPTKAIDFLLKKPCIPYEFRELDGSELLSFLERESQEKGFSFTPEASRFFASFLAAQKGDRSWTAVNEMEKFRFWGKRTISVDDMNKISYFPEFDEVWITTRKILSAGRWFEKVPLLEKLFLEGADSSYIFNSLAFAAKEGELLKLSDYDILIKSGKLDFPEALLSFVLG